MLVIKNIFIKQINTFPISIQFLGLGDSRQSMLCKSCGLFPYPCLIVEYLDMNNHFQITHILGSEILHTSIFDSI